MGRNYYSDYVAHMMRQYLKFRADESAFQLSEGTLQNIRICKDALSRLPETERELITSVYAENPVLKEGVVITAAKHGMHELSLWAIIKRFEREIATERGLT